MKILISSNPYLYTKRKHRKRVLNTPNNLHDPYNGYEYVDLGLPSGTLWATCNVGASKPEEYGMYFAWGETTGYTGEQVTAGEHLFDWGPYNAGSAASISDDLTLSQDAAHIYMSGDWCIPTQEEFTELINSSYTTITMTSDYNGTGVAGRIITSKSNGNSIFLPTAGWCGGPSVINVGSEGRYWLSTWCSTDRAAYYLSFGNLGQGISEFARCCGHSVRGVIRHIKIVAVDLGLPSGTKWANCNVGAKNIEDYGLYFAWGETTGYTGEQVNAGVRVFDEDIYNVGFADSISTNLTSIYDAVNVNLGGKWRMPTEISFRELINSSYTTMTWTDDYNGTGIAGYIITSKSNGNSIFLPAAGKCDGSSVNLVASYGLYWSYSYGSMSAALSLSFNSQGGGVYVYNRYLGYPVRGIIPPPHTGANPYNGHEYVDLGLPSGLKWATCNIGAVNPQDYGLYFAWGEAAGYTATQVTGGERMFDNDTYNAGPAASISRRLTIYQDVINAYMGGEWRMPDKDEFNELINSSYTTTTWTSNYKGTGVAGRLITSKTNGNSIFLPAAGSCWNSSVSNVGSIGEYWTTQLATNTSAWRLYFRSGQIDMSNNARHGGLSLRGVCE